MHGVDRRAHRLQVLLQMMNVAGDRVQQAFDMRCVAVNMTMSVSSVKLHLVKGRFHVMKLGIQLRQIGFQVCKAAVVVCKLMYMACQSRHLASIGNDVPVLRRVSVMAALVDNLLGFHFDLQRQLINVVIGIGESRRGKCRDDQAQRRESIGKSCHLSFLVEVFSQQTSVCLEHIHSSHHAKTVSQQEKGMKHGFFAVSRSKSFPAFAKREINLITFQSLSVIASLAPDRSRREPF